MQILTIRQINMEMGGNIERELAKKQDKLLAMHPESFLMSIIWRKHGTFGPFSVFLRGNYKCWR